MAFAVLAITLLHAAQLLSDATDIVTQRVQRNCVPPWLRKDSESIRWLSSLSDDELQFCERSGLAAFLQSHVCASRSAPKRLLELSARSIGVHDQFPERSLCEPVHLVKPRRVKAAKLVQIDAMRSVIEELAFCEGFPCGNVRRILDVGGGHGHLAGHIASQLKLRVRSNSEPFPVICLDRDLRLLHTGKELLDSRGDRDLVSFVQADAVSDDVAAAQPGDLIVGLHPCGILGDRIASAAVKRRVAGVVLTSCCLQKLGGKVGTVRRPLSATARSEPFALEALTVDGKILGLTNRVRGFATASDLIGRETRIALAMLLESRGHVSDPSKDIDGLSRHCMRRGLVAVAKNALEMRGDYMPFTSSELEKHAENAKACYRQMRAWSLPRAMLGEVLEMAIVLDRACFLEEGGTFSDVSVCRLFPDDVSMRNLTIIASPKRSEVAA